MSSHFFIQNTLKLLSFGFLCAFGGLLVGCPSKARVKPAMSAPPKSDKPIIRLVQQQGVRIKYQIFNTSPRSFYGLAIIITGDECNGPRSHQVFIQYSKAPLSSQNSRSHPAQMPFLCKKVSLAVHEMLAFKRKMKKIHHPTVRYSHKGRTVKIAILNSSILPFRGLAVLVLGKYCGENRKTRSWFGGTRFWLYPGYKREFTRHLPINCVHIRVAVQDLVDFVEYRKKLARKHRLEKDKIEEAAKNLLKGL